MKKIKDIEVGDTYQMDSGGFLTVTDKSPKGIKMLAWWWNDAALSNLTVVRGHWVGVEDLIDTYYETRDNRPISSV